VKKYKKKPIVIEAKQWFKPGDHPKVNVLTKVDGIPIVFDDSCPIPGNITTLEGDMMVVPGDWIIKGIKGEFYPCKPDIFAATYDEVVK